MYVHLYFETITKHFNNHAAQLTAGNKIDSETIYPLNFSVWGASIRGGRLRIITRALNFIPGTRIKWGLKASRTVGPLTFQHRPRPAFIIAPYTRRVHCGVHSAEQWLPPRIKMVGELKQTLRFDTGKPVWWHNGIFLKHCLFIIITCVLNEEYIDYSPIIITLKKKT
ncbi:hypothetical protein CEXT_294711 [Caerostris extrusa]|uniref:Uncharacterized protein n=1 Tax=Caerostris extrusa TaxID=172846 RepID=A0AAV4PB21_CAEEX|nr:hypothetical protein CEXT_294711 [Caerostris extrusa]